MFRWALILAVIALIASILEVSGMTSGYTSLAVIFLVASVVLAMIAFITKDRPSHP